MSKEEFKPLHHLHDLETGHKLQTTQSKEIEENASDPCKELYLRWQVERERLEEEVKSLKSQLESLEREKARLLEEKEGALMALEGKKAVEMLLETISERLLEKLKESEKSMQEEVIKLVFRLLKMLLLTDLIPKEDLVLRILSKVLESGVELKGQVVLYLNPKDSHKISSHIESLKERLGDRVQLSLTVKEDLREGEVLIETPKFWIERRYEDIIADLIEDLKNERGI